MNAKCLEDLTKLAQSLNLAKQDAIAANRDAKPVLSIILHDLIAEVGELERKAINLLSAVKVETDSP